MFIKYYHIQYQYILSYTPPVITQQPIGGIVGQNESFTVSVKVKGSPPLEYKWYRNNFPILSSDSDTLIINDTNPIDDGTYYCKIKNNKYVLDSDSVRLQIISYLNFVLQPISVDALPNSTVFFTASAEV